MVTFVEFVALGIALGAIYALMAIPLSLLWNTTRTLDFAVGGYAVVGGIAAAKLGTFVGPVVGLLLGGAFGAVVGGAYLVFQARGSAHTLAPVLVSVGVLFGLVSFTQWRFGLDPVRADLYTGAANLGGVHIAWSSMVNVAAVCILTGLLGWAFRVTRYGRWMRACAVSARDAPLVGIPVRQLQFSTFVLAGVISALAGELLVVSGGLIYDAGFALAVLGIGAVIVFGMRGPISALAGGMALGVVASLGTAYLPLTIAPVAPLLFLLIVLGVARFDAGVGVARA